MMLSIVIPVFNEQENIALIHNEVINNIKDINSYEIIFINDGSTDNSWNIIKELRQQNANVKGINFSRNFGHQIALTAGYDAAMGDVIISMDADLQDPPQLLSDMLQKWQSGFSIVYARRIDRADGFLKKITASLYYAFLECVSDIRIPRNVGDFRLIDRKVLHYVKQCREKSCYLRGVIAWSGFNYTFIDFRRPNRVNGESGYSWSKMLKLATDGIAGFSLFPLRISAYIGFFILITDLFFLIRLFFKMCHNTIEHPFLKLFLVIIYFFIGMQFLLFWFLGEYIGRIFEQQRGRPLYIIDEMLN